MLPAGATSHINFQRQSVQWVGRRCCAARYDGRAAARPYRLEQVPIIIGKWYYLLNRKLVGSWSCITYGFVSSRILLARLAWVSPPASMNSAGPPGL